MTTHEGQPAISSTARYRGTSLIRKSTPTRTTTGP